MIRKNVGCLYFVMSFVSCAQQSVWLKEAMLFENSDVSRVHDCWNTAKNPSQNEIKYALRPNTAYLDSYCHTCLVQKI